MVVFFFFGSKGFISGLHFRHQRPQKIKKFYCRKAEYSAAENKSTSGTTEVGMEQQVKYPDICQGRSPHNTAYIYVYLNVQPTLLYEIQWISGPIQEK